MVVASLVAGRISDAESDFRYHLIAYRAVIEALRKGEHAVFELFDEEQDTVAYVLGISTPERAAELLERYGIPSRHPIRGSEPDSGQAPEVPEQTVPE